MSEYQTYEFLACDRPLTAKEQDSLRAFSSRAIITPSRFAVDYAWGSFKGNAADWMDRYFDVFHYRANWGAHEFMLRLPRSVLSLDTAEPYCVGDSASVRAKGDHVVLAFRSDDEGGEWIDENRETLASLLPVRAELAGGDLRALYLAWLGCAQAGELAGDVVEPPCPPGLRDLSPALEALAAFLRIDFDLIDAAAVSSPELAPIDDASLEAWVAALPEAEKTSFLLRLIGGADAHLRGELVRRFRESHTARNSPARSAARTVGELLDAAKARAEEREREEAARAAKEKARREREAAKVRDRHLAAFALREGDAWRELDALIATKQPKKYDEAVVLLCDLRDVLVRAGRQAEAAARLARLREEQAKKPSLIERLRMAGLVR